MIKPKREKTLRESIFLSFILQAAVSILLIGVISTAITLSILKTQAFNNINSVFDDISDKINSYAENVFDLSQSLMYDSDFVNVVSFGEDINTYRADVLNNILAQNPDITAIKLTVDKQDYTVSQGRSQMFDSGSIGYSKAASLLDKNKKNYVWYMTYDKSNTSNIFFIRKIRDPYTGAERGTVQFQINVRVFYNMAAPGGKFDKGEFCILSDTNQPILNGFDMPQKTMQKIIGRTEGTDSYPNMYYMYTPLPITGWELVYRVSKWSIYKIVYLLLALVLLLCSVAIITAMYFSKKINQTVVMPISELEKSMQSWGENDVFTKPREYTTREVNALYNSFETMTARISDLINTNYKQALMQRESELKMLQSQINPHFIFNTLEAINSFAAIYDVEEISEITMALASLIEEGIGYHSDSEHTFGDEITLLDNYITIMRIRYGNRITMEKHVESTLLSIPMPSLILQPIAENAVIHGLIPSDKDGVITINAREDGGDLCIQLHDNGIGMDKETVNEMNSAFADGTPIKGKSIGLTNVNRRLKLLYGDKYRLSIDSEKGKFTAVTIRIAIQTNTESKIKEDQHEV